MPLHAKDYAWDDTSPIHATLTALTTDIVTAHLGHNMVSTDELPMVIRQMFDALAHCVSSNQQASVAPIPAVSIRASMKATHIACLECGAKKKVLKQHLMDEHDLTPEAYRKRWELPDSYPLVAPDYAERRRQIAKDSNLGRSASGELGQDLAVSTSPPEEPQPAEEKRSRLGLRFKDPQIDKPAPDDSTTDEAA